MTVTCPHCGHQGNLPEDVARVPRVRCSQCQQEVWLETEGGPVEGPSVACTRCGQRNASSRSHCTHCGTPLGASSDVDNTMGGLIPYKNSQALMAYYFGIFSLVPCVGIPLGIIAVVLGTKGLKYADEHPEAKGKAHAWVGIILGGGLSLLYLIAIIAFVVVTIMASNR